jgi:uncharacterized membrane protein YqjE
MEESPTRSPRLSAGPKRFARHLLAAGGNRLELFVLEMEEERRHFVEVLMLALGVAVLGLLAVMGLTAAAVVLFWQTSPITVLLALGAGYGLGAFFLHRRLLFVQQDWKTLSATLEQLQKDGECLKKILA